MNNQKPINICACMGKQGNDPMCPCKMISAGLKPHNNWTEEEIKRFKYSLQSFFDMNKHNEH